MELKWTNPQRLGAIHLLSTAMVTEQDDYRKAKMLSIIRDLSWQSTSACNYWVSAIQDLLCDGKRALQIIKESR